MKRGLWLYPALYKAVPICAVALFIAATPTAQAQLKFNITSSTLATNSQEFQAIQAAAARWSAIFTDSITVNLQVESANLGSKGALGVTSYGGAVYNYSQVRAALAADATSTADQGAVANLSSGSTFNRRINYVSENGGSANPITNAASFIFPSPANAKALGLLSGTNSAIDATIQFNTQYSYEFNPAQVAGSGKFDFTGIATHEIGHALGFGSGVDDLDGQAGSGTTTNSASSYFASTLDLFRYSTDSVASSTSTNRVVDFTAGTAAKYFSIDGGRTLGAQFSTGGSLGDGFQASHWKDNLGLGIMDPTTAPGEVDVITNNDKLAFDAIGYNVAAVPETSLTLTFGLGLVGMGGVWLRQRRVRRA